MEKVRLAVLASGRGTTAEAAVNSGVAEVVVAITNNGPKNAGIWERASRLQFPLVHIPRTSFRVFNGGIEDKEATKVQHTDALLETLSGYKFDWIFLDGCSFPVGKRLIQAYPKIFNIHPAPLDSGYPDFGGVYGLTTYAWVKYFAEQVDRSFHGESTLHLVSEKYDSGEVLLTQPYDVIPGEAVESLGLRVLKADHALAVEFCKRVVLGELIIPMQRSKRLIAEHEIPILESAKQKAIADYPHG